MKYAYLEIPASKEDVEYYAGPECPETLNGCIVCDSWRHWAETGLLRIILTEAEELDMAQRIAAPYLAEQ